MLRANLLLRRNDSDVNLHITSGELDICRVAPLRKWRASHVQATENFLGSPVKIYCAWNFSNLPSGSLPGILLQRGIAIFDREAAALPGRFLPELGRSHGAAIFFRWSFGPGVRRRFARGPLSPRRSRLLPQAQNP